MKIIQIFNQYLDQGGEENSVNRIARHLEASGHIVQRFQRSSHEWTGTDSPSNIQKVILTYNNELVLNELKTLHKEFQPDIWIAHNVLPVISLGVYQAAKDLNVPLFQWLHNYRPLSVAGTHSGKHFSYFKECLAGSWRKSRLQTTALALLLYRAKNQRLFENVTAWIAVSQRMKSIFDQNNWYPERTYALKHIWDIEPALPLPNNTKNYFLFMGRLIREKGIEFLVELFSAPQMQSQQLLVAGTGPLLEQLRRRSTSNIVWLGYIDKLEKKRIVRGAKAMLIPSTWHEPLSTLAYEAFEQSVPVITSDMGGMPEIISHKKTGLILPVNSTHLWKKWLENTSVQEFETWGLNGRRWLENNISIAAWNEDFLKIVDDARKLPKD